MENQKKCPACGAVVRNGAESCVKCGLEGLNLGFLNKAGYEKWVKEVLQPHRDSLVPKVYAGTEYGLILTVQGDLYGIGSNQYHQLADTDREFYEQPVLMARNVISAAAGPGAVYVTHDGKVHWQHIDRDDMPELTDVREVYAEVWKKRYWFVKDDGEELGIGSNYDGALEEKYRVLYFEFPEVTCLDHQLGSYTEWSDGGEEAALWGAEYHFKQSEHYRVIARKFGEVNVELEVNEVEPNKLKKAMYFAMQVWMYAYKPRIYVTNHWIFDPVPFKKPWMADKPHRVYGRPVLEEEYRQDGWETLPGVKTVVQDSCDAPLTMMEDGSVFANGKKLEWLNTPVKDLARGSEFIIMACANRDILWCKGEMFGTDTWKEMIEGRMNVCRLPDNP